MACVVEGSNPSRRFCDIMEYYGNSVGRVHNDGSVFWANSTVNRETATYKVCGSNPHIQNMLLSLAQWSQNVPLTAGTADTPGV